MPNSTSDTRRRYTSVLSTVGLLAILAAAAMPLLHIALDWFGWLYAAGAAVLLVSRFLTPVPKDAPLRLRRMLRMEIWTALVFVAGAVFILLPGYRGNDWLAFTLAGGVLTLYTSLMIPRAAKEAKK